MTKIQRKRAVVWLICLTLMMNLEKKNKVTRTLAKS